MRRTIESGMRDGRYRTRTALRGVLPGWLSWLAPKGIGDCEDHERYLSTASKWRCYHCEAGIAHESPFSPAEQLQVEVEALVGTIRYLSYQPPSLALADAEMQLAGRLQRLADEHAALARS